jgi:hypothetical protein
MEMSQRQTPDDVLTGNHSGTNFKGDFLGPRPFLMGIEKKSSSFSSSVGEQFDTTIRNRIFVFPVLDFGLDFHTHTHTHTHTNQTQTHIKLVKIHYRHLF